MRPGKGNITIEQCSLIILTNASLNGGSGGCLPCVSLLFSNIAFEPFNYLCDFENQNGFRCLIMFYKNKRAEKLVVKLRESACLGLPPQLFNVCVYSPSELHNTF